jgi:dephospho-CoA kinase
MMTIGITGGIGSGKTTVCNIFRQLGVPVFNADAEAKNLYASKPLLSELIRTEISKDVFDKKGKLDKAKLATLVFNDSEVLAKLNSLVHPLVMLSFTNWKKKNSNAGYVLKEAAILFESNTYKYCDKIITVVAPEELRLQRVMERDRRTKKEILQIMLQQWSDEEKIQRSDFIIHNDEEELVIPQVLEIHKKLSG